MQYKNEILIHLPISKTVELFDNPDNLKHWQPGLQSFEHLSGTPGQPGAKSIIKYDMNGRKMELLETITVRNLPHEFSGTYETKGVFNIVKNFFYPKGENQCLIVSECEFQFSGFMKILAFLMPGMFKKQSQKFLEQFKNFAESQE